MPNEININSSKTKVYCLFRFSSRYIYRLLTGKWIYFNRGFLLAKIGQNKRAVEDFSKVITHQPNDINSLNNRALVYIQIGQYESGCQDAKKACTLGNCKLIELAKGKRICR
jgi:tetratricopeptide (TPR) repeat protein